MVVRLRQACCLAFFCVLRLFAQDPVRIEGIVLDAATGYPIADAKVDLVRASFPEPLDTVTTDASGAFHFAIEKAGSFAVQVVAPGFQAARGGGAGIDIDEAAFADDAKPLVHSMTLRLARSAVIFGRVRDGETAQAMASVTVTALRMSWIRGRRTLQEERVVSTDAEGDFRLDKLPAGDYLIEISQRQIWPGTDPDLVQPVNLQPGREFNAGTIDYARRTLPKLRIKPPKDCREGRRYQVGITEMVGDAPVSRPQPTLVCPAVLTVDTLVPGRYRIGYNGSGGTAEIRLEDGADLEFELKPTLMGTVTGRITCDCDPSINLGEAMAQFQSVEGYTVNVGTSQERMPFSGPTLIRVTPQPRGSYIKEVLFNGVKTGTLVNFEPGASATVDITLSDHPAALAGTVTREARVILAPWPLIPDTRYPEFQTAEVDPDGAFEFQDLAPGKYRIVAVSQAEWNRKEAPEVIAGWLAKAQEITLTENQTARVTLDAH